MSLIEVPIGQQAFEVIHNRIGGILKEELETQAVLTYDEDLSLKVYKERDIPFNDGERCIMNVMMDNGEFEMQTLVQQTGVYRYNVEVTANAPGRDETLGDQISMLRVQKIIGKCAAIIRSPRYTTLGFPKPFIWNRHVEAIMFGKPIRQDSSHTCMGRMTIVVKANEDVDFVSPIRCVGTTARVYLGLTDRGYIWSSEFGDVFDQYFAEEFA